MRLEFARDMIPKCVLRSAACGPGNFIPVLGTRVGVPSPTKVKVPMQKPLQGRVSPGATPLKTSSLEILKGSLTDIPIVAPVIFLFRLFVFVAAACTVSQVYVRIR